MDKSLPFPLPPPGDGSRTFTGRRKVRLGDVDIAGRLRLDALARYAQDVSNDDTNDAELEENMTWVVRRTTIDALVEAQFGEYLDITTFCSGIGSRWADRRLSVKGDLGAEYEISTLWIFVQENGSPRKLTDNFMEIYGPGLTNHKVSARLTHPSAEGVTDASAQPWPLRVADFDTLEHVNNAQYWAVVEEVRAQDGTNFSVPYRSELEYGGGITPGAKVSYAAAHLGAQHLVWWDSDGAAVASAATQKLQN